MAKKPLYTVKNISEEPRWIAYGPKRKEPIDVGAAKALPIGPEFAIELVAQGFEVTGPDGKAVKAAKAKA